MSEILVNSIKSLSGTSAFELDSDGSVSFDTSTLHIDATNNRVGIGTTTPNQSLDITSGYVQLSNGYGLHFGDSQTRIAGYSDTDRILFFTGNTERVRLDASGNLLVGKTTTATETVGGVWHSSTGVLQTTADGATVLYLNRETSDGAILELRKDNSAVGRIGSTNSSTNVYLSGTNNSNNSGLEFGTAAYLPMTNSSRRDATVNLGSSSWRYKDAYLSGGVYVGGTGAANYLDDYEEGTFTPTIDKSTSSPTVSSYLIRSGRYTVVGNVVYWYANVESNSVSGGSGHWRMTGLPFTSSTPYAFPVINARIYMSGDGNDYMMKIESSNNFTALFTSSNDTRYTGSATYVIFELSGFYYI